jgi:chromosome segregation ATPase
MTSQQAEDTRAMAEWQQARTAARDAETRYGQALANLSRLRRQRDQATDIETIRDLSAQLTSAEQERDVLEILLRQTRRAEAEAEARVQAGRRSVPVQAADVARLRQQLASATLIVRDRHADVARLRADLGQAERKLEHAQRECETLATRLTALTGERH